MTRNAAFYFLIMVLVVTMTDETFVFEDTGEEPVESVSHLELDTSGRVRDGERSYELLKSEAPFYGVCWLNALDSLHVACKQLNDETQARLGLAFANCFLEKIGGRTYPCPPELQIKQCTKNMDDRAFQAYTQFFTHTQSICFFLANQIWQSRNERTISRLSSASYHVAERLEQLQNMQRQSIETQFQLNEELSGSRAALQEFEKTLRDKHSIEHEILIRFLEMRDFLLDEVSKFYSIGFYVVSVIVFYLLTTPTRTKDARLWVFLILAFNLVVERLVVSNILTESPGIFRELWMLSVSIDDHIWMCRKAALLIAFLVLLYFAVTYRDYAVMNHDLLNDIRKQNEEIKRLHELTLAQGGDRLAAMMNNCFSSDDSDSSDDVSDEELAQLTEPVTALVHDSIVSQNPDLNSQLKAIVAVESVSPCRYNLRTRSAQSTCFSSGKKNGSRQTECGTKSFARNIFSSDEES